MSASGKRFDVGWDEVRDAQTEEVVSWFPDHDDQRAAEGEELQEKDMMGSEVEHIVERQKENVPEAVTREFTKRHMGRIAAREEASEVNTINTAANDEIANVGLEFPEEGREGYDGVSDMDVGAVEKEDVTGLVSSIDEIVENLDLVERITAETNPDDDVSFMRQGHLTEMMIRGSGGAFDYDNAEAGVYPSEEFISGAPRYFAFDDTFDGVMQVAGTGSIQTTMRPKIYEEHEGDADAWIRDFSGGGERVGMHALSPLIYGPFQASPVIDEVLPEGVDKEEATEEDFKKVVETLNGRDKAYGQGFQNEHDSKGLGKSEGEYVTENSKAAYSPELAEIQDMKDQVDFPADSEMTFSAPTAVGKMKVVPEDETYDEEADYDTLEQEVGFLDAEDIGLMRVGHENWDLSDGRNVIRTNEFPEHQRLEGTVYVVDEDGNREKKRVVLDYQDEQMFPEMEDEDFQNEAMGHYQADATAVWESWRMRPDKPAFEYRDNGNNPFRDASIATQVGSFRNWKEIQQFAGQQLGLTEGDAQELRLGVNGMLADPQDEDYLDEIGMDYTVNDEYGITLQDAWTGDHEMLDDSLLDIVSDGVAEMTDDGMDQYSVQQYRDEMGDLIYNGLTPGEMMASDHVDEIDPRRKLYDEEDRVVGGEPVRQQNRA
jgi:hypothetical protein